MKNLFFAVFAVLLFQNAYSQNNVGINTDSPDASAVLDLTSTEKGLLIPRMTSEQRGLIAAPAKGLMVFQVDGEQGFYFYDGNAWTTLKGVAGPAGPAGLGFENGTAAGQVYLTSGSSPYAPQSPVSVNGDVTMNNAGTATISSGAINTAKLANSSVTVEKISATGTAGSSTFLRGDGSWAAAGGGSSSTNRYAVSNTDVLISTNDVQDVVSINLEANKVYAIYAKVVLQRAGGVNVPLNCRVKFSSNDAVTLNGGVYWGGNIKAGTNFSTSGGFDSDGISDNSATTTSGAKFISETIIKTTTAGTLTYQINRKPISSDNYYIRPGSYITATALSE